MIRLRMLSIPVFRETGISGYDIVTAEIRDVNLY